MPTRVENGLDVRGPLLLGGSAGVPGNVPVSAGPGSPPTWGLGAGVATSSVTLDFGASPALGTRFTFTATAEVGQRVLMTPSAQNGDELEFNNFTCAARVTATNTIEAWITPTPGPVAGTRIFDITIV